MSIIDRISQLFETKNDHILGRCDCVIASGTGISKDGTKASPQTAAVAKSAAAFYRTGLVNKVLATGGFRPEGGVAEWEAISEILEAEGVPASDILLEKESQRTWSNATECLPIVKENCWKKVMIVAHPLHAYRVRATYRKLWEGTGIRITVIKANPSEYGDNIQKKGNSFHAYVFWELIGIVYSKWKGYI